MVSIDELMVGFRGPSSRRKISSTKPVGRGISIPSHLMDYNQYMASVDGTDAHRLFVQRQQTEDVLR